ncbi:hypothetical protein SKAU_G00271030 [Synaphobranchus kaupii]|uniref:Uncharacterized protein n=1 Tax=Synaphobranchus kaupii TaxID=118154 RepID=A0A9Q1F0K5_SYNKA|nr:hypothetical protein SKAU_G00271030 [Synaphobranchus kaupii]
MWVCKPSVVRLCSFQRREIEENHSMAAVEGTFCSSDFIRGLRYVLRWRMLGCQRQQQTLRRTRAGRDAALPGHRGDRGDEASARLHY